MVCLSKLSSHTMRSIKCCTRASVWCCISSALEVTLHMHLKHLTDTMSLVLVKFLSKLWCQISYYTLAACGPVWFVRASPPNQITTCHMMSSLLNIQHCTVWFDISWNQCVNSHFYHRCQPTSTLTPLTRLSLLTSPRRSFSCFASSCGTWKIWDSLALVSIRSRS